MSFLKVISIEPVVFFYVLAIFAEYDVIGDIFYVKKCIDHLNLTESFQLHICTEDLKHNKSNSISNVISKEANRGQQIYNGILYSTSILSSFVAGTYADKRSKFVPIILAILGSAIVQILMLSSLFIRSINELPFLFSNGFFMIFLCSFVSGITGGTSTLLSSCFAHVAEKCNQSQRTSRMTIIEACLFGGGFFGFSVAGAILRKYPNSFSRYEFNFAMFLVAHLTMAIYVIARKNIFDKPQNHQSPMTFKLLMTSVFHSINRPRTYRNHRFVVYLILLSFTLIAYWNVLLTTTLFIYTRNLLGWPSWKYSYFSSAKFGISGVFLCILPIVQYVLGTGLISCGNPFISPMRDKTIITIGLLSRTVTIMMIGMASLTSNDSFMIVALVTIIFAEYPIPALRSLISKVIEPNEKAQMFAVMAAIQSICFFTGGIGFLTIYNSLLGHVGPGWMFISMGILQLISMCILCYVEYLLKNSDSEQVTISRINEDSNNEQQANY